MKTAIVYVSNHGATEWVAQKLAGALEVSPSDVINLRKNHQFDPDQYDRIIIGGSIHAGHIQRRVKDFCKTHTADLLRRQIGLFVCCMHTGEQAQQQFEFNFPELLRLHSSSNKIMGGAFDFEKMNWFEKIIVKKVAGVTKTTSSIDEQLIHEMVAELKKS